MKKILIIAIFALLSVSVNAQKKTVLVDMSHDVDTAYTRVNANVFEQYEDLVGTKIGANLIINQNKEIDAAILANVDVLIILSPLDRKRVTPKNDLTCTERLSIINYISNGGKVILFMDEEDRVDMQAFGGNDIVKPFGMAYGLDLPMMRDIGATSLINDFIKHNYELPYSGSRSLAGGTPISTMNGEQGHVHGAYTVLENGGTLVAFAETMAGIFMGGVRMTMPDGATITWRGKDDKAFMQDLIEWLLN
ncbi:MAG: hypothetical protein RL662_1448 [Bacteroidota bacterium]|jgi:hypothetical protein